MKIIVQLYFSIDYLIIRIRNFSRKISLKILKSLRVSLNNDLEIIQKIDTLSIEVPLPDSLKEISEEDQQLLHAIVQTNLPTSQAYEHAWGYLIQSTRYGNLRWYDPRTNSLIFFGKKSSEDHTLVVPTFFATPEHLASTLRTVQKLTGTPQIILKNIDPRNINLYLPYGFRSYADDESWDLEARFDDQTFPQLLIDLKTVIECQGSDYRKLRKYLHRGRCEYRFRPYQVQDQEAVLNLLALKDSITSSQRYSASHDMYLSSATEKYVIEDNEQIVGFTVTSDISSECTALCAGIFLPGKPELAPWGLYQTMEKKYRQGFNAVNLGGSETYGTMEFKRQLFRPVRELSRTHLIFHEGNIEVK